MFVRHMAQMEPFRRRAMLCEKYGRDRGCKGTVRQNPLTLTAQTSMHELDRAVRALMRI
jgi:hypothetical protein